MHTPIFPAIYPPNHLPLKLANEWENVTYYPCITVMRNFNFEASYQAGNWTNALAFGLFCMLFCSLQIFFKNQLWKKNIRVSTCLDLDQAWSGAKLFAKAISIKEITLLLYSFCLLSKGYDKTGQAYLFCLKKVAVCICDMYQNLIWWDSLLACVLLITRANSLDTCWTWSGSKLFGTLMVRLSRFFENGNF